MEFWENGVVTTLIAIMALLLAGTALQTLFRSAHAGSIPVSIIGGALGLLLGPSLFGLISLNTQVLESLVYHGLAVVFFCVALQTPPQGKRNPGVLSFALGVPFIIAMQMFVGLLLVLALNTSLHPGFGLMLPLGFEQGPGQALSLGSAWEEAGMADGAQVGLIYASVGFFWSIVLGIPLVFWGRRHGLINTYDNDSSQVTGPSATPDIPSAGSLEPLTAQFAAISAIYLVTYGFVWFLANIVFATMPGLSHMCWGFHFIFGAIFAMGGRPIMQGLSKQWLNDDLLGRVSTMTVDIITCAALAAVQIAVFKAHFIPIILITTVGGIFTFLATVWLARRAFPEAPFEHCIVWFGLSTGTLPMGLALLRIVDPNLKSPATMSAVLGSGGALIGGAPLMIVILPMVITSWPHNYPNQGFLALGILLVYQILLIALWAKFGPLRLRLQPLSLWPKADQHV